MIEVAEVGSINGCTRKYSRRKWRKSLGGILEEC
jgi:hypothetical protein